jgi:excisionase family DNA binding protein
LDIDASVENILVDSRCLKKHLPRERPLWRIEKREQQGIFAFGQRDRCAIRIDEATGASFKRPAVKPESGERSERGEATLLEAAEALAVSTSTVLRMIRAGILPANQLCKGAPWIIRHCDLQHNDVRREAMARRTRHPVSCDPLQQTLDL